MVVFEEARKLWFECGLEVEELRTFKLKFLKHLHRFLVYGSTVGFCVLSVAYTAVYFESLDPVQLAYLAVQSQWGFLSTSLVTSVVLVERKIRRMLETFQNIVDKSDFIQRIL